MTIPIVDWRDMPDDWSMHEEMEKRGFVNSINSLLIINHTFLDASNYDEKLEQFISEAEQWQAPEWFYCEVYKIIITDHSMHLQVIF